NMVRGKSREPRPPPRMRLSTSCCMIGSQVDPWQQPCRRKHVPAGKGTMYAPSWKNQSLEDLAMLAASYPHVKRGATNLLGRLGPVSGVAVKGFGQKPVGRPAGELHEQGRLPGEIEDLLF